MKSVGVVDGGLFTESYCNICNAQLISESQRTAHYENCMFLLKNAFLQHDAPTICHCGLFRKMCIIFPHSLLPVMQNV
uniref:Uncharacterized protein n=1 Tax=Xiphophorus couchianus TaxID=32473 RepID=A0A3B5LYR3_9TELE